LTQRRLVIRPAMKRFPSRCASAIQVVRPAESTAETQPQLHPAFLRLSAVISHYFTPGGFTAAFELSLCDLIVQSQGYCSCAIKAAALYERPKAKKRCKACCCSSLQLSSSFCSRSTSLRLLMRPPSGSLRWGQSMASSLAVTVEPRINAHPAINIAFLMPEIRQPNLARRSLGLPAFLGLSEMISQYLGLTSAAPSVLQLER